MQIHLCVRRAYQRLINDKSALSRLWYVFEKISPLEHVRHPADSELIGKIVMALVVGSVFYGPPTRPVLSSVKERRLMKGVY